MNEETTEEYTYIYIYIILYNIYIYIHIYIIYIYIYTFQFFHFKNFFTVETILTSIFSLHDLHTPIIDFYFFHLQHYTD